MTPSRCTYSSYIPILVTALGIHYWEAVAQRRSVKKVFLETSQNSQENTCATVFFLMKLQAQACNFI